MLSLLKVVCKELTENQDKTRLILAVVGVKFQTTLIFFVQTIEEMEFCNCQIALTIIYWIFSIYQRLMSSFYQVYERDTLKLCKYGVFESKPRVQKNCTVIVSLSEVLTVCLCPGIRWEETRIC
jgi:hypothetical protein